jgi:hypothetical protein
LTVAATAERRQRLRLVLLLRLSDDLRQDWCDLLKGVTNLVLSQLTLAAAPVLGAAEGVLAESALAQLPLAKPPLLGLLILLKSLRQLLQRGGDLWILESVLLRCVGMYHDDFPLSL